MIDAARGTRSPMRGTGHQVALEHLADDERLTDSERAAIRWAIGQIAEAGLVGSKKLRSNAQRERSRPD